MLRGNIELVDLREVVGWAQDDAQPDAPVSLLITDNDQLIGRILANRYRRDLEEAGIGSGRHGFELKFEKGLAPLEKHVLRVCREHDGINLAQSPITIEPTQTFDAAVQKTLAELVRRSGSSEQDLVAKVDFLAALVEAQLQQLAEHDSKRVLRNDYKHLLQRWRRGGPGLAAAAWWPFRQRICARW